jgi:G3E family GTPase
MACADMVILNKVDLVDGEQITKIKRWLNSRFQRYRLIEASRGDVPLPVLLSAGRFDPVRLDASADLEEGVCTRPNCDHAREDLGQAKAFSAWSYETDQPVSLDALRDAVSKLPARIYRAKGVIYTVDAPERRAVLQAVGRRVDISLVGRWGKRTPRTRIVAIGAAGTIDEQELRARLEQCVDGAATKVEKYGIPSLNRLRTNAGSEGDKA